MHHTASPRSRLSSVRRNVHWREAIGVLLWVATVAVVFGTLVLPFVLHLVAVFLWLILSGVIFVGLSRSNLGDVEAVFRATLIQADQAREQLILQMATYSEARDALTGRHIVRVREVAKRIALELGLAPDEAEAISRAAVAHDLGKIGTPDAILGKPGKLTPKEFEVIKEHTRIGERALGDSPLFRRERQCARHHHERWDGGGYPDGLAGEEIPLVARITSVADVFDALISERPYKQAWPPERATAYLSEQSGKQFDPAVVDAFLRIYDRGDIPAGEETPESSAVLSRVS